MWVLFFVVRLRSFQLLYFYYNIVSAQSQSFFSSRRSHQCLGYDGIDKIMVFFVLRRANEKRDSDSPKTCVRINERRHTAHLLMQT